MDWLIDLIFSILIAVAASSTHMTDLHRHNSVTCPDAGAFTPVTACAQCSGDSSRLCLDDRHISIIVIT